MRNFNELAGAVAKCAGGLRQIPRGARGKTRKGRVEVPRCSAKNSTPRLLGGEWVIQSIKRHPPRTVPISEVFFNERLFAKTII